jgi:hypothetical protein
MDHDKKQSNGDEEQSNDDFNIDWNKPPTYELLGTGPEIETSAVVSGDVSTIVNITPLMLSQIVAESMSPLMPKPLCRMLHLHTPPWTKSNLNKGSLEHTLD